MQAGVNGALIIKVGKSNGGYLTFRRLKFGQKLSKIPVVFIIFGGGFCCFGYSKNTYFVNIYKKSTFEKLSFS